MTFLNLGKQMETSNLLSSTQQIAVRVVELAWLNLVYCLLATPYSAKLK